MLTRSMHISTDTLARDFSSSIGKPDFARVTAPTYVSPAVTTPLGLLYRTSWELTGSDSYGFSLICVSGGVGSFALKRKGVPMGYGIKYSLAGGGASAVGKLKIPTPFKKATASWGPGWAPQLGTSVWTLVKKDLDFQDLIGPMVVLSGAAALGIGISGNVVWFNSALGLGLAFRTAAAAGADKLLDQLGALNKSAGGVAFLGGLQASTPDLSFAVLTGMGWPDNS